MARYTPGIAGTLIGSVGNYTFSRNRFGPYIRTRAIPVNPNTPNQQLVKAFMAAIATGWTTGLTQVQRDAWATYAANVPRPQVGGGSIFLTGLNMFIRSNVSRGQQFLAPVFDAPTEFNVGDFSAPQGGITGGTQIISVTFTEADDWVSEDGAAMMIWAGRPQGTGVNFFKGPYQVAGIIAGNLAIPPTSPNAVALPFLIPAGTRAYFRATVTRADGRLADDVKLEATIL